MSLCAVKRGIITLRDCGAEATGICTVCNRPICQEHTHIDAGAVLCVECYARRQEEALREASKHSNTKKPGATPAPVQQRDNWDDPSWPFFYRHQYYTTSSYNPFYSGTYYDSYYNDYDVRSFHNQSGDIDPHDDPHDAGGFYDS